MDNNGNLSPVEAFLDFISRPRYASANVARALLEGRPEDIGSEAMAGLTGQTKGSYYDLAKENDVPFAPAVGFLGDVALDPLTYVPLGKVLSPVTKAVGELPVVQETAQAIRNSGVGQWLGKSFIPDFMPKEFVDNFNPKGTGFNSAKEAWDSFTSTVRAAKGLKNIKAEWSTNIAEDVLKQSQQLMKEGKITKDSLLPIMAKVENANSQLGVPPEARPIVQKLGDFFTKTAQERGGIGKAIITDADYNYFYRSLSDSEKKILKKNNLDMLAKEFHIGAPQDNQRKLMMFTNNLTKDSVVSKAEWLKLEPVPNAPNEFKDSAGNLWEARQATIDELDAAHKTSVAKGLKFGDKDYIPEFSVDYPNLVYKYGMNHARQVATHSLFENLKATGLVSSTKLDGMTAVGAKGLENYYSNPAIAKQINETIKAFTNEESTSQLLKTFDQIQGLWKKTTLGVFPAYHVRNFVGNVWNNFLAGDVNIGHYIKAEKIQEKLAKGGVAALSASEKKLYEEALKNGVLGRSFYQNEAFKLAGVDEPSLASKVGSTFMKPVDAGMKVGANIEDNSKLAHFIAKRSIGMDAESAAKSVRKYLFDYSELTPFEQQVMKRVFPFYAWTRKNIPLLVDSMMNKTGKMLLPEKLQDVFYKEAGSPDQTGVPDYVKDKMPFFIKQEGGDVSYFPMQSFLPYGDIRRFDNPMDTPKDLLSPFIKLPIELTTNHDLYRNQPITDYKGQTKEFLGMDLPAPLAHVASQVRILSEVNRWMKTQNTPDAQPVPSNIEKAVRSLTGIKIDKYNVEKSMRSKAYELTKQLQALKVGLKKAQNQGRVGEQQRIALVIDQLSNEIEDLAIAKKKRK